jgi:hypothetical protein
MKLHFKDREIRTKDNLWTVTGYYDTETRGVKITRFEGSVVGIASTAFQVAIGGMVRALRGFPA